MLRRVVTESAGCERVASNETRFAGTLPVSRKHLSISASRIVRVLWRAATLSRFLEGCAIARACVYVRGGKSEGEPEGERERGHVGVCAAAAVAAAARLVAVAGRERVVHGRVAVSSRGGWWIVAVRAVGRIGRLIVVFVVVVVVIGVVIVVVVGDEESTKTEEGEERVR